MGKSWRNKSFSLLEVIIVVTLISLLAIYSFFEVVSFYKKSRDTKRKADLSSIRTALEQYYDSLNYYPDTLPNCDSPLAVNNITFLSRIPCDPITKTSYAYIVNSNQSQIFRLYTKLENLKDDDICKSGCGPSCSYNYGVSSPNVAVNVCTAAITPTPIPSITPTPTPTQIIVPTSTPTPLATNTPIPLPTATSTPLPPTNTPTPLPTPTTAPTATATPKPTPTSTTILVNIYTDSLATGWQNWSYGGTTTLNNTTYVHTGTYATKVALTRAYGGLYFQNSSFNTTGHTNIQFYINGGSSSGQYLYIYLIDRNGNYLTGKPVNTYIQGGSVAANTWRLVSAPLSALQGSNTTITGIVLQDESGTILPSFYIDDLGIN